MSKPMVRYNAGPGSWLDWLLRRRRARWHTYTAQVGPDGTYVWVDGEATTPGTPLWGGADPDVVLDPPPVDCPDGTRWIYSADFDVWTGWIPGEYGTWEMSDAEWRRIYRQPSASSDES